MRRVKAKGTSVALRTLFTTNSLTWYVRFMFVEFKNADDAAYAMATMNGHPFAKHTFYVNRFIDVEKYVNMDETWVEPEPKPYKPKVR